MFILVWLAGLGAFLSSPAAAQNKDENGLHALLTGVKDTAEINALNQLAETVRSKNPQESISLSEQASRKAEKIGFDKGRIVALHNLGIAYGYTNDFVTANVYLLKSAQLGEKTHAWKSVAGNFMNIGSLYAIQGNNEKWIEYYLKALKICENIGDREGEASLLYGIGNSLASEKKYDQALENYLKSLQAFQELGATRELPKVYVNIGLLYKDLSEYGKALEYFDMALEGFASYGNLRGRAVALVPRADTYFHQGQNRKALFDLGEAIQIGQDLNYLLPVVQSRILMGKILRSRQQYDPAIQNVLPAVTLAKRIASKTDVADAYQLLADLYYSKGDYRNAFTYQGLHASYKDSLFNADKSRQIQEMQVRYETEKKEQEIEILRRDQFLNSIYLGGGAGIVAFLAIIGFIIINRQRVIIRKDRVLSQKENQIMEERKALMEAELLNRKLTEEQLRKQIDFNNREMTTYALNLIQKNELLDNIKGGIEEIRSAENGQVKPRLQSLLNTVNYSFHLDKDWENFRLHFEQVHQSFYHKLHQLFPDLGANDVKLCALLRLNLDTKALATVLDISPESAKVARHRLRKKLSLTAEQNLTAFLTSL